MIGYLPRYAPFAARWPYLANLRNRSPRLRKWSEQFLGLSASRHLPSWRKPWREAASRGDTGNGKSVALFVDTFNRYFEPENIDAAIHVLGSAGFAVHLPKPDKSNAHPLCCGRTFLSVGLVEEARREAERTVAALTQFALRGIPVVGLEPSCVFGFRDEIPGLVKNNDALLLARGVVFFEEFLAEAAQGRALALPLKPVASRALVHGHCHQKAFGAMGALETVLKLVPELDIEVVETSCCGMAGSFGYGADTIDVSSAMGELSLLPAIRKASAETLVLADGVSCRAQIKDGTGRNALHVARLLSMSIDSGGIAAQ
jgi:Fe-S oxidoreductase